MKKKLLQSEHKHNKIWSILSGGLSATVIIGALWVYYNYQDDKKPTLQIRPVSIEQLGFGKKGTAIKCDIALINSGGSPIVDIQGVHSLLTFQLVDKKPYLDFISIGTDSTLAGGDILPNNYRVYSFDLLISTEAQEAILQPERQLTLALYYRYASPKLALKPFLYEAYEVLNLTPAMKDMKLVYNVDVLRGPKYLQPFLIRSWFRNLEDEYRSRIFSLMEGINLEEFLGWDKLRSRHGYITER